MLENHDASESARWRQVNLRFADYTSAEYTVTEHLAPLLTRATEQHTLTAWFFTRKHPHWRLRYHLAAPDDAPALPAHLDTLCATGPLTGYTTSTYEPETHAFGGRAAMRIAHTLFHHDSTHLLHHLTQRHTDQRHAGQAADRVLRKHRRELSLLLCRHLFDGAGMDWCEQGDIWARVATTRTPPENNRHHDPTAQAILRRFLTTDTAPDGALFAPTGLLHTASDWVAAFTATGRALAQLNHAGELQRGLRAVLAHHVLFHWNRLGLPHHTQAHLAHTSAAVIFGNPPR